MKTRLRKSQENSFYWVEMHHSEHGWTLAHPSPLIKEEAEQCQKKIRDWKPKKKPESFDYTRKARFYLDEIDLMNLQLNTGKCHGPIKVRIQERKRLFIGYTIQLLGDML